MQLDDYVKIRKGEKNYIRIKVSPRQPKTEIVGLMWDWTIKIKVGAVPEKNKANEELIRFISESLNLSKTSVEIISWAWDTIKLIRISA